VENAGLLTNTTAAQLEEDLAVACNYIPVKYQQICADVVSIADQIIEAVVADVPPSEICVKIGLC